MAVHGTSSSMGNSSLPAPQTTRPRPFGQVVHPTLCRSRRRKDGRTLGLLTRTVQSGVPRPQTLRRSRARPASRRR